MVTGNWHIKLMLGSFADDEEAREAEAMLDALPCDGDVIPNFVYQLRLEAGAPLAVAATFVVAGRNAGTATVRTMETVLPMIGEHVCIFEVQASRASEESAAAVLRIAQGRQAAAT